MSSVDAREKTRNVDSLVGWAGKRNDSSDKGAGGNPSEASVQARVDESDRGDGDLARELVGEDEPGDDTGDKADCRWRWISITQFVSTRAGLLQMDAPAATAPCRDEKKVRMRGGSPGPVNMPVML